jgi:hypothetical protein
VTAAGRERRRARAQQRRAKAAAAEAQGARAAAADVAAQLRARVAAGRRLKQTVSEAGRFHLVARSILTEIYLCNVCSCYAIEGGNARRHGRPPSGRRWRAHGSGRRGWRPSSAPPPWRASWRRRPPPGGARRCVSIYDAVQFD